MEEIKKIGEFELNKVYCGDCLEFLKKLPDKCVDLVLTDPPYGFLNGMTQIGGGGRNQTYEPIKWDNKPSKEVFDEIIRVSKNQIIFGGEHLAHLLPPSRGWYVWDKMRQHGVTYTALPDVKQSNIRATLNVCVKNGKLFERVSKGKYKLKE
jgi:tRNA1(Val) A37 N6-methylase TrmN6